MKYSPLPLLHVNAGDLLHRFIAHSYLDDPGLFGLRAFAFDELAAHGFERSGEYDDFFLMEKTFRTVTTDNWVHLKVYLSHGEFRSNGLDFGGVRIGRVLKDCQRRHGGIEAVELLLYEDGGAGSLIVNGFLDVRFGRCAPSMRGAFRLLGVSTDYSTDDPLMAKQCNTSYARHMKKAVPLAQAVRRHRRQLGLVGLVNCVERHILLRSTKSPAETTET